MKEEVLPNLSDKTVKEMYKSQGINLVPIPKGSGKALNSKEGWSQYRSQMYEKNIPDDQDFAVILGKISNNLVVLDFDHCNDIEQIQIMKGNILDKTLVVRTGNGYHVYFTITELPNSANTFFYKDNYNLELKSDGAYVVGASSRYHTKNDFGYYVLTHKKYDIISNTNTVYNTGISAEQLISVLEKKGWNLKNKSEKNSFDGNNSSSGDDYSGVPTSILEKGGWFAGERYNNGFKLALRRFHNKWKYDDILSEAYRLNQTCDPPHSDSEVQRWVNDAQNQYQKNLEDPDNKYFKQNSEEQKSDRKDIVDNTAKAIQESNFFKCAQDSDELFWYDGRIYRQNIAEPLVRQECEKRIKNCTTHERTEVINKIKIANYIDRKDIDGKPNLLTLENGILNLDNLQLENHHHSNVSCVMLPVSYIQPNHTVDTDSVDSVLEYLKNTLFLKYLESCFTINDTLDEKQFHTVLEIMASCLIKRQFDKAFMFIGTGSNGKSVLLDYLESILGTPNVSSESIHDIEMDKFKKAELFGKMANIYADIDSYELQKTGNLKIIISGDSVSAQKKHGHPFKFNPYAKLIFSANRFPHVRDQSDGFFRRFIIVNWKKQFEGENKDTHLREKLTQNKEERNRVFSLLVLFAKRLSESGRFTHEEDISILREQWNKYSDPIIQFINERITEKEGAFENKKTIYSAYREFCLENEIPPLTIKRFGLIFGEYYETEQHRDEKGINRKVWIDIRVRPVYQQEVLAEFA